MKSSTAKKITNSAAPLPKIHPEIAAAVQKKKRPKAKPKHAQAKPKAPKGRGRDAAEKKATPSRTMRTRLLSERDARSVIDQIRIAFSVSAIGLVVGLILGTI